MKNYLKNLALESNALGPCVAEVDDLLDHVLGRLGLAGARLAADDRALVHAGAAHGKVGLVGNGKNVRRCLRLDNVKVLLLLLSSRGEKWEGNKQLSENSFSGRQKKDAPTAAS